MQKKLNYYNSTLLLLVLLFLISSCEKEEYALPAAGSTLQNDVIKRSLGPNMVTQGIEFAYAMAIPPAKGKLLSAEVEASIPGATGTYLENNSYFTNGSGADVPVPVGSTSVTNGSKTTVTFTKDTAAATLRYFYIVPEAARGKSVSFTFSAKSSNGETVSYTMGPYTVSKMDMIRSLTVTDAANAYISIADMAIYNAATAATKADKIDLVYLYRNITTSAFNHALVSPAADAQFLPGITLPAGVNKSTQVRKAFGLQDKNLAQLQNGIYIDDVDFEKIDLSASPNYAINLVAESGIWVETADKKYKAYIFINKINNTAKSAEISIKRYSF